MKIDRSVAPPHSPHPQQGAVDRFRSQVLGILIVAIIVVLLACFRYYFQLR